MEKVPFGKFGFINPSVIHWMRDNLNSIIAITTGLLAVAAWTLYQWKSGSPADYLAAEKAFHEWSGDKSEKFFKLQKILKTHPELHAKYDGKIAQKLLINSEQGLASSFSKSVKKRTGELSPYYAKFSKGSFLIAEKKFDTALAEAKELKQSLDHDENFWKNQSELVHHGGILYGYNLLRIAFLEQMVGDTLGELAAWKDFKREAGWLENEKPLKQDRESIELIEQNFQKNDISLRDFIQYREIILAEKN